MSADGYISFESDENQKDGLKGNYYIAVLCVFQCSYSLTAMTNFNVVSFRTMIPLSEGVPLQTTIDSEEYALF